MSEDAGLGPGETPVRMMTIGSESNLTRNTSEDEEEDEEELVVGRSPDGGWGWVVCAASFLCNMILDGIAYCFGVLLTPLCK